jgi:hypothetical protein
LLRNFGRSYLLDDQSDVKLHAHSLFHFEFCCSVHIALPCFNHPLQSPQTCRLSAMSILLCRVILSALADVDLIAALSLTAVSAEVRKFILEEVITTAHMTNFLQQHQYALQHDVQHRLFSDQEIAWIHLAFETLRHSNSDFLFENTVVTGLLGPLLSRTPMSLLAKTLPDDFKPAPRYSLQDLKLNYKGYLSQSWIQRPDFLYHGGPQHEGFYQCHAERQYLHEGFLFCERYIDQSNKVYHVGEKHIWRLTKTMKIGNSKILLPNTVLQIQKDLTTAKIAPLFAKRCIQAIVQYLCDPFLLERRRTSSDAFLALFELPGWMQLWTPSEFGWWYAIGLSQYGPACVQTLIEDTFENKKTALLWLFLGAHCWFHDHDSWPLSRCRKDELAADGLNWVCCDPKSFHLEEEYLKDQIAALSREDRVWLVEQIVRRASEFGVCKDLGANVFNYFVVRDLEETDIMFSKLLEEVTQTRLQYRFEFTISLALEDFKFRSGLEDIAPLDVTLTRKYQGKLLRRDLELYAVLS